MESIINNSFISGEDSFKERYFEPIPDLSYSLENIINSKWWTPSQTGKKRIMLCGTYPIAASPGLPRLPPSNCNRYIIYYVLW